MAITNGGIFRFFRVILILLLIVLFTDILLSQVPGSLSNYFENHILAIVSGGLILILGFVRINYFSYEDEYEIIHIRSRSLLFGKFESPAQTRYEFPKRTVEKVELKKMLFQKKLIVHLKTQQGEKKICKFDLSFVPFKKAKHVLSSLTRISEQNNTPAKHVL